MLQRRLWKNFRSSNDSPLPGSRGTFCENGAFRDRWKHEILVELHIPDASLDHKSASVVSLKFPAGFLRFSVVFDEVKFPTFFSVSRIV